MKKSAKWVVGGVCFIGIIAGGVFIYRKRKVSEQMERLSEEKDQGGGMIWPCDSRKISSPFGKRTSPTSGASTDHKGVDIAVPQGSPVYAVEDGTVTLSWDDQTYGGGNSIRIQHANGLTSHYCHLSSRIVKKGDVVKKGQGIGLSGGTPGTPGAGTSTGPHLHFALKNNGVPFDPLTVLKS